MAKVILDASAVLLLLQRRPGHERVRTALASEDCAISTIDLSLAALLLSEAVPDLTRIRAMLALPNLEVLPFTEAHAFKTVELADKGPMGIGECFSLATAATEGADLLTAGIGVSQIKDLGVKVRVI